MKKITMEELEALIVVATYEMVGEKTMVCTLTLTSGFEVVGQSSCLNKEQFDEEIGRQVSRKHAVDQLWQLEGYHRQAVHCLRRKEGPSPGGVHWALSRLNNKLAELSEKIEKLDKKIECDRASRLTFGPLPDRGHPASPQPYRDGRVAPEPWQKTILTD